MDMTALSVAELTTLLQKAGAKKITAETIKGHLAAGAPARADGKVHFIHYAAWLAKHVK